MPPAMAPTAHPRRAGRAPAESGPAERAHEVHHHHKRDDGLEPRPAGRLPADDAGEQNDDRDEKVASLGDLDPRPRNPGGSHSSQADAAGVALCHAYTG